MALAAHLECSKPKKPDELGPADRTRVVWVAADQRYTDPSGSTAAWNEIDGYARQFEHQYRFESDQAQVIWPST